jgi:hypothetical protein
MGQQKLIDERQSAEEQPLHSMRENRASTFDRLTGTSGIPSKAEAVREAETFVRSELALARQADTEMKSIESKQSQFVVGEFSEEWRSLEKERITKQDEAMGHLGNVIHTLQDATSPMHRGMQVYSNDVAVVVPHALGERSYPNAGTEERTELEGATRWGYDLFKSGELPDHFFDQSGRIALPEQYKNAPASAATVPAAKDEKM